MNQLSGASQRQIILHSVLAGLTPLIPIPFVDDLVKTYFKRRMVRKLAAAHSQVLNDTDVATLADDPDTGCLLGCVTTVIVYPLKAIFRKIFFFLEWKRATDIVSHTYYQGFLIESALGEKWIAPAGLRRAEEVRRAIDQLLLQVNTSLIERAVKGIFNQSKAALKGVARLLQNSLRALRGKPSQEEVAHVVEALQEQEEQELEGVIGPLQNAINKIPAEHFEELKEQLAQALGFSRLT
jgi:hypothetical protein